MDHLARKLIKHSGPAIHETSSYFSEPRCSMIHHCIECIAITYQQVLTDREISVPAAAARSNEMVPQASWYAVRTISVFFHNCLTLACTSSLECRTGHRRQSGGVAVMSQFLRDASLCPCLFIMVQCCSTKASLVT